MEEMRGITRSSGSIVHDEAHLFECCIVKGAELPYDDPEGRAVLDGFGVRLPSIQGQSPV